MFEKVPPLGLDQLHTFGGLYSRVSAMIDLRSRLSSGSRGIIGWEERALSLFVFDLLERMLLADGSGADDGGPGVDGLEESLEIRK